MKIQRILVLSGVMIAFLSLSSFTSQKDFNNVVNGGEVQEGLIVYATFDGKEDYGYNFITKGKDGEEYTLTFQKVEDSVLKMFDLNSETLIGTKFKITFNKDVEIFKDENEMEDEEEINTITQLEKL